LLLTSGYAIPPKVSPGGRAILQVNVEKGGNSSRSAPGPAFSGFHFKRRRGRDYIAVARCKSCGRCPKKILRPGSGRTASPKAPVRHRAFFFCVEIRVAFPFQGEMKLSVRRLLGTKWTLVPQDPRINPQDNPGGLVNRGGGAIQGVGARVSGLVDNSTRRSMVRSSKKICGRTTFTGGSRATTLLQRLPVLFL